jgi:transcriptional regulator with XRE-family HTH domain
MDFRENMKGVHIGTLIKAKFIEKSISRADFARKISRAASDINDIFKRKSLDIALLIRISKALDYDFIRNVYYKDPIADTIYLTVKIKEDEVKDLDFSEDFICFVKKQSVKKIDTRDEKDIT